MSSTYIWNKGEIVSHKKALYAGTFDPFTCGHYDIVTRALTIFDEVTILLAKSPMKKTLFSLVDRETMLKELFIKEPRIKVETWGGLLVDYARQNNIGTIVRGLRPTGDFEIEFQMATMNKNLFDEVETVFLMTGSQYYYISSSLVKEIFVHGGDISKFVPPLIHQKILATRG